MNHLIQVSTFFQTIFATLLADDIRKTDPDARILLLKVNSSFAPEITPGIADFSGANTLFAHFDEVVDLNDALWPVHPRGFNVSASTAAHYEKWLRGEWKLPESDELRLYLSWSPSMPPGSTLARIFRDSELAIHFDGLMSYGPLPGALDTDTYHRVSGVHYLELIPGLRPASLHTPATDFVPYELSRFRSVIDELVNATGDSAASLEESGARSAVLIGQYLGSLDLMTLDEEIELHNRMVTEAIEHGCTKLFFKPHPASASSVLQPVQSFAEKGGVELVVVHDNSPAELLFAAVQPELVVSCFSTALATAHYGFGIEARAVGAGDLLDSLTPYQNSNRIPVTIAHYCFGDQPGGRHDIDVLQELVYTVSYCMHPHLSRSMRPLALEFLEQTYSDFAQYFKRRRLTALDLPGKLPPQSAQNKIKRHARRTVGSAFSRTKNGIDRLVRR